MRHVNGTLQCNNVTSEYRECEGIEDSVLGQLLLTFYLFHIPISTNPLSSLRENVEMMISIPVSLHPPRSEPLMFGDSC